jgi:LmbE family N-acetylglucosaminyl deacetylase
MTNSRDEFVVKKDSACAVIVAHPDDETLWAGGLILMHPEVRWTIVSICRKSDPDRAPKFFRALEQLNAAGRMGDMDDGPEQFPLDDHEVQNIIVRLLDANGFDLVITHGLNGEYTRHLRHEETAKGVLALWRNGKLDSEQVWMFAYEDGGGKYLPRPAPTRRDSDILIKLPDEIWQKKYDIVTKIYGFESDSFEAKATQRQESFCCLKRSDNRE